MNARTSYKKAKKEAEQRLVNEVLADNVVINETVEKLHDRVGELEDEISKLKSNETRNKRLKERQDAIEGKFAEMRKWVLEQTREKEKV